MTLSAHPDAGSDGAGGGAERGAPVRAAGQDRAGARGILHGAGIYAGWALFAVPIFAAILSNLSLAALERRRAPGAAAWALASAALIAASLVVFFVWVFPANQATENWTVQPEGWEALRRQWEYGHAVNAVVVFAAFLATCLATVRRGERLS